VSGATHHPMPSPPPSYRVATAPDGCKLWWAAHEAIPLDHTAVRLATLEEAQVMRRIEAHPNPPVALGRRIGELMERTV
jgi:hypothetical protein